MGGELKKMKPKHLNGMKSQLNKIIVMHKIIWGVFYKNGIGVEKNIEKSIYWYQKSAENENKIAQHNLGKCYQYGWGVEIDKVKAFEWYEKSAKQNYGDAQNRLGDL